MTPVLEEISRRVRVIRGAVEQRDVVASETAEERHVVRAREHVHRVDLQDAQATDISEEGPFRRRTGRSKTLRGERDPPRLHHRQIR